MWMVVFVRYPMPWVEQVGADFSQELGRPELIVINCSGVFRDLFINQMNLLSR